MLQTLTLSALFLYTLAGGFLFYLLDRVFAHWTGDFRTWPVVLPAILGGFLLAWLTRVLWRKVADRPGMDAVGRWGEPLLACLSLLAVVPVALALCPPESAYAAWETVAMHLRLDFAMWKGVALSTACLWFVSLGVLLPILVVRGRDCVRRGSLCAFVGVCTGVILARLFVGRVNTLALEAACLAVLILASAAWWVAAMRTLIGRLVVGGPLLIAVVAALILLFTSFDFAGREPLRDVNPFAIVVGRAKGWNYTDQGDATARFVEGRLVRCGDYDTAAQGVSQLIPVLLKPAADARIAVRLPKGVAPILTTAETGELKGLYDAIWVEVPPAWTDNERDHYGAAAFAALLDHLKEDGLAIYDLDASALDARMVMERILLFRERFAHVQLWVTGENNWQLVASRKPITVSLEALGVLLDRPEIAAALRRANAVTAASGAPLFLLPCCMVADTQKLVDALQQENPVKAKIPRGEADHARALLFDDAAKARLFAAFAPAYELEMPWVDFGTIAAQDLRDVLLKLRDTRRKALTEEPARIEAGALNPTDPFLQGFAIRSARIAADLATLGDVANAIKGYDFAFCQGVVPPKYYLEAADLTKSRGQAERTEIFYRLAIEHYPNDTAVLLAYAEFLKANGKSAEAEARATHALRLLGETADPALSTRLRFFIASCIVDQPARAQMGLAMARRIAASAQTKADKDAYIPAYGELLIQAGRAKEGIAIRRHYNAYGELLAKP